jgi:hypothetical protein
VHPFFRGATPRTRLIATLIVLAIIVGCILWASVDEEAPTRFLRNFLRHLLRAVT